MLDTWQHTRRFHDTAQLLDYLSADGALSEACDDLRSAANEYRAADLVRLLKEETDDGVAVGPSDTKGIHRDPAYAFSWPWNALGRYLAKHVRSVSSSHLTRGYSRLTAILYASASMAGFNFSKRALGGIMPLSRARTHLTTDARPLAPSRCPMFALIDPLNTCRD